MLLKTNLTYSKNSPVNQFIVLEGTAFETNFTDHANNNAIIIRLCNLKEMVILHRIKDCIL